MGSLSYKYGQNKKILSVEEQLEELKKEIEECEIQIKKDMDKKDKLIRSAENKKNGATLPSNT